MKGIARTDCQFYDKGKHDCKGLNELYCEKKDKPCRFYKPKVEAKESEGK